MNVSPTPPGSPPTLPPPGVLAPIPARPDAPDPRRPRRRVFLIVYLLIVALLGVGAGGFVAVEELLDDGEFAFLHRVDGAPVAWDPCRPIRYVVNDALAPPGALADLDEAIARIERASGLRFEPVGRVGWTVEDFVRAGAVGQGSDVPGSDDQASDVDWAPVLIAWEGSASFTDEPDAYGGSNPIPGEGDWRDRYVTGFVVMNADQELEAGFGSEGGWGPAFLHELGHLVGLDHVESRGEVMAPVHFPPWPTDLGEGDVRGLRRLGATACRPDGPEPPSAFAAAEPLPVPVG